MRKSINPFSALSFLDPQSLKVMSDQIAVLIETRLWAKILFAMFIGVGLGFIFSEGGPFPGFVSAHAKTISVTMSWLGLPAKFFLRLIQMVIIPLIIASIIRGLASTSDINQIKKLGIRFGVFTLVTTALAASLGVILVTIFKPGIGMNLAGASVTEYMASDSPIKFSMDVLLDILPRNPLASIVGGEMLDVVVISLIAGVAILSLEKEQANSVIDLLEIIQSICMNIISWAMKLAPYAVFGMMAQVASSSGVKALQSMSLFIFVTFLGFIIFIGFYTLLIFFYKGQSPIKFLKSISMPMLLAFSTSSSAATMPLSMKVAEEDLSVLPSVAGFLIPLGATINMAGTAIWQTSAVVFLSQVYNIDLNFGQIFFVVATSIGSSIGSPGVPGVGIGVLATVLTKIGIPIEGVSLILGVDRLIDMGCTVVNVSGDLTAAKIFGTNDETTLSKESSL
ncbi:MAG: dicarboxylate/amino acid:cation symporter [Bdellovibrionales bacterium]|nr:dicarboxylate/amino acid:cation symporter [Bdellovibrionales bacterium]